MKHEQLLEKAFGDDVTIEWKLFDSGGAVNEAIVAGAVDRHIHGFNRCGQALFQTRLDHEVWCTAVSGDGSRIAAGTACGGVSSHHRGVVLKSRLGSAAGSLIRRASRR